MSDHKMQWIPVMDGDGADASAGSVSGGRRMTKEEAIDILRNAAWLGTESELAELEEAVNMACKALEFVTINNTPDEIKVTNCNDKEMVYKQDAIDVVLGVIPYDEYWKEQIEKAVNELPSAQPEILACGSGELIAQSERKMQCNFCSMSICTLEGRPCSRKVVKHD